VVWNPLWPVAVPPDAFIVASAVAARVRSIDIQIEADATDAEALRLASAWTAEGRLTARPVFASDGAWAAEATRGLEGTVAAYALSPVALGDLSPGEAPEAQGKEADRVLVSVARSPFVIERDQTRTYVALRWNYGGRGALDQIEETFFDEAGVPLALNRWTLVGDRVVSGSAVAADGAATEFLRLDRDAEGRITRVRFSAGAAVGAAENASAGAAAAAQASVGVREAAYSSDGRPRELRIEGMVRRFQWDERGLLVRETLNGADSADGTAVEWRYEYTFDRYGSWIERTGIGYRTAFGTLVPDRSVRIKRTINYR
jgi:YD repeat-containing protein